MAGLALRAAREDPVEAGRARSGLETAVEHIADVRELSGRERVEPDVVRLVPTPREAQSLDDAGHLLARGETRRHAPDEQRGQHRRIQPALARCHDERRDPSRIARDHAAPWARAFAREEECGEQRKDTLARVGKTLDEPLEELDRLRDAPALEEKRRGRAENLAIGRSQVDGRAIGAFRDGGSLALRLARPHEECRDFRRIAPEHVTQRLDFRHVLTEGTKRWLRDGKVRAAADVVKNTVHHHDAPHHQEGGQRDDHAPRPGAGVHQLPFGYRARRVMRGRPSRSAMSTSTSTLRSTAVG